MSMAHRRYVIDEIPQTIVFLKVESWSFVTKVRQWLAVQYTTSHWRAMILMRSYFFLIIIVVRMVIGFYV